MEINIVIIITNKYNEGDINPLLAVRELTREIINKIIDLNQDESNLSPNRELVGQNYNSDQPAKSSSDQRI